MNTTGGSKPLNLDYLAAKHAQRIIADTASVKKASDVENAVTKALGVLQENGVYACFVFALSRAKPGEKGELAKEAIIFSIIIREMLWLLKELPHTLPDELPIEATASSVAIAPKAAQILHLVAEHVTRELERLLLAKEVLEQMLIYARYGAKARLDVKEDSSDKTGATA